jgi:hypothetical protein
LSPIKKYLILNGDFRVIKHDKQLKIEYLFYFLFLLNKNVLLSIKVATSNSSIIDYSDCFLQL